MPRVASALLSVALAGLFALAAYADDALVPAVVVGVQLLLVAGPSPLDDDERPVRAPSVAAALAGGAIATVLTLWPDLLAGAEGTSHDAFGGTDTGMLAGIMPAIAVAVLAAMAAQMLRRGRRTRLVSSTAQAVAVGVCAALAVGWIGAVQSLGQEEIVAVGAAGVAAGLVAWLAPFDRWLVGCAAVVVGGVAGFAVASGVAATVSWELGLAVGAGAALFAVLGQLAGSTWSADHSHPAAAWGFPGALSLALAAPVVYVGGQLVGAPGL